MRVLPSLVVIGAAQGFVQTPFGSPSTASISVSSFQGTQNQHARVARRDVLAMVATPDKEDRLRLAAASPVWTLGATALALARPATFDWATGDVLTKSVQAAMVIIGMSLTSQNLKDAANQPKAVGTGLALQYTLMPVLAFAIAKLFRLSGPVGAGLVLVGSVPGGALSNVMTHIAGGDVALSVVMTALSTVAAVVATPFLTSKLIGHTVQIGFEGMLRVALKLTVVPILIGVIANSQLKGITKKITPYTSLLSSVLMAAVCGSIVSQNGAAIRHAGLPLILATTALHVGGFALGYANALWTGLSKCQARTVAMEVGVQNSAMAARLASLGGISALPAALSTIIHTTLGSAIGASWRAAPIAEKKFKGE